MRLTILSLFLPVFVQSSTFSDSVQQSPSETPILMGAQPASLPAQQNRPLPTSVLPTEDLLAKKIMASMSNFGWAPISTIVPTETVSLASETAIPSPPNLQEEVLLVVEDSIPAVNESSQQSGDGESNPSNYNHIELRQNPGVGGGAPPAVTQAVQVSPITTVFIGSVQVVYTQLFSAVPNQAPSPVAGSIGMGTLTGSVGVVKTKAASGANHAAWSSAWGLGALGAIGAVVGVQMI
ncbi:hypothetical protein MMC14_000589 [Varicellaria rhodocarpa]|nr:hypothetical protein [Varicellaria rhodocarpa]